MSRASVDHLFTLPLPDFVAARNELAKALKAQGDKETALRIQKLPKPSISAWAINQLVRADRALIDALLASLDRQRDLQLAGLGAGVDRSALKEAKQTENDAIARIERALPGILEPGGHAAGRSTIERCVRSIRAAAVHTAGRPLLENGHLTIDFDTPGFEALGADEVEEFPKLRLVTAGEDKHREKEERLKEMQRSRIEAQAKIEEERREIEEQRRRLEAERKASEERELERTKQAGRLGEAAKILGTLRAEHAKLEEQAITVEDAVRRARIALERAERDATRAKEDLQAKKNQIAKMEELLGLFDEEDEG